MFLGFVEPWGVLSLLLLLLLGKLGQSFIIHAPTCDWMDRQRVNHQHHHHQPFQRAVYGRQYDNKTERSAGAPLSSSSSSAEADEWKERAAKLRQEIQDYETLRNSESNNNKDPRRDEESKEVAVTAPPEKIEESTWLITYRFILGDDDNSKSNSNNNDNRESFGGTVHIKFRNDGYTDLLSQKASGDQVATIVKVWGWDLEPSAEDDDDKEYLLFSMDFAFPIKETMKDKTMTNNRRQSQRLYYQARHTTTTANRSNKNNGREVELSEGTITIKQEIGQRRKSQTSRWSSLFTLPSAGILAQFRYVGNFVAKPTTTMMTPRHEQ